MPKTKKPNLKKLREKAWKAFSIYIRRKYADRNGNCKCVTCDTVKHWKEMQAGHFIDGRTNSILFDERGVFPQCYRCNCMLSGNKVEYFRFMQNYYGDEVIDELRALRLQAKKYSVSELEEIINHYQKITNFNK